MSVMPTLLERLGVAAPEVVYHGQELDPAELAPLRPLGYAVPVHEEEMER